MSYRLQKPITELERADFIVQYNHNQGLLIADGSDTYIDGDLTFKADYIFALEPNEMMSDVEVEVDVYDEETETYHKETVIVYKPVINPDYEQEEKEKREAEFHKEFFNTSLGYIRRSVSMADGSHKDFLSDLLPTIAMAVNMNTPVTVLAYNKPDFSEPVTDWTQYQHIETVTAQFIQECFMQLQNDFLPNNGV